MAIVTFATMVMALIATHQKIPELSATQKISTR